MRLRAEGHLQLAIGGADDVLQVGRQPAQLGHQGLEIVVHDQHARGAVAQRERHLRRRPAHVDGVGHGAGPPAGHVVLQEAVGVQPQHAHAVAWLHVHLAQGTGQAGDAVAELGEGAAARAEARGGPFGVLLQGAVQGLGEVDVHGDHRVVRLRSRRPRG